VDDQRADRGLGEALLAERGCEGTTIVWRLVLKDREDEGSDELEKMAF